MLATLAALVAVDSAHGAAHAGATALNAPLIAAQSTSVAKYDVYDPSLDLSPAQCVTKHNNHPLPFSEFCTDEGPCWPSMYIIGVQKAATSSLAKALDSCGLVAYALPTKETGFVSPSTCKKLYESCKETLHVPVDINSAVGQKQFTSLYNHKNCHLGKETYEPMKQACSEMKFLSATPSSCMRDDPVGNLYAAIPLQLRMQARYVVILREPIARMLSWFNHLRSDARDMGLDVTKQIIGGHNMSSFASFVDDHAVVTKAFKSGNGQRYTDDFPAGKHLGEVFVDSFHRGNYSYILDAFSKTNALGLKRSQLLVLQFEQLAVDTRSAFQQVSTHFGLPILTNRTYLPEINTHDNDEKVLSIKCETRDKLHHEFFKEDLEDLYEGLHADVTQGVAPAVEPQFPRFDHEKTVHCQQGKETTLGDSLKESARAGAKPTKMSKWREHWHRSELLAV